jgi:hypothetical protein
MLFPHVGTRLKIQRHRVLACTRRKPLPLLTRGRTLCTHRSLILTVAASRCSSRCCPHGERPLCFQRPNVRSLSSSMPLISSVDFGMRMCACDCHGVSALVHGFACKCICSPMCTLSLPLFLLLFLRVCPCG